MAERDLPRDRARHAWDKLRAGLGFVRSPAPTQVDAPADEPADPAPASNEIHTSFTSFTQAGWIPPDPTSAAGPSDLVVAVNASIRIFDRSGGQLSSATLADFFDDVIPNSRTVTIFDPWVVYDPLGDRFIVLALARDTARTYSRFLIAVSNNSTAQGPWCSWNIDANANGGNTTDNWADYAKVGVNRGNVVITANMFDWDDDDNDGTNEANFQYVKMRVLSKPWLYDNCGGRPGWHDFWDIEDGDGDTAFTIQPALSWYNTNGMYMVSEQANNNELTVYRFDTNNDGGHPGGVFIWTRDVDVTNYDGPPNARQPGTATRIDTGDARLLNLMRDRSGNLWTAHTIACGSPVRACVRWYEIRPGARTRPSLKQEGTYAASSSGANWDYYYPAIAGSRDGAAMLTFTRSGPETFPEMRIAGRTGDDAENRLQTSRRVKRGEGCYIQPDARGNNRWGDYGGISLDPADLDRWWVTHEFVGGNSKTCANNPWATRTARVSVNGG